MAVIHRIEGGWLQVNDSLSKQERRPRRRQRRRVREPREEEPGESTRDGEEKTSLDLVV